MSITGYALFLKKTIFYEVIFLEGRVRYRCKIQTKRLHQSFVIRFSNITVAPLTFYELNGNCQRYWIKMYLFVFQLRLTIQIIVMWANQRSTGTSTKELLGQQLRAPSNFHNKFYGIHLYLLISFTWLSLSICLKWPVSAWISCCKIIKQRMSTWILIWMLCFSSSSSSFVLF